MSAPAIAAALLLIGPPAGQDAAPATGIAVPAPADPQAERVGLPPVVVAPAAPPPEADARTDAPPQTAQTSPDAAAGDAAQDGIVVVGDSQGEKIDPIKAVNRVSFAVTQKVDDIITAPAARAYKHVVPKPIRKGIRNFLNNLREPVVFANYLLQLKPGKAAETIGRFAINSTIGVAGFVDVAGKCPFDLPWRPNGFGDTLGVYGVKPGPFVFLPLIGPTTVRDLVGGVVDRLASPYALGGPFRSRAYLAGTNTYRILDRRAEEEDELAAVRASADPYVARRDLYLKKREDRVESLKGGEPSDQAPGPHGRCRSKAGHEPAHAGPASE